MMEVKVVLGDWSNDGHGMTETFYVELPTVMDKHELEKMYKEGKRIIGFDLIEDICSDYEDNRIPEELKEKLEELGFEGLSDDEYIGTDEFLRIYMFYVQMGYKSIVGSDDSFSYHVVSDKMPNVRIGGYGLFWN